jgi:hypothetical protein
MFIARLRKTTPEKRLQKMHLPSSSHLGTETAIDASPNRQQLS